MLFESPRVRTRYYRKRPSAWPMDIRGIDGSLPDQMCHSCPSEPNFEPTSGRWSAQALSLPFHAGGTVGSAYLHNHNLEHQAILLRLCRWHRLASTFAPHRWIGTGISAVILRRGSSVALQATRQTKVHHGSVSPSSSGARHLEWWVCTKASTELSLDEARLGERQLDNRPQGMLGGRLGIVGLDFLAGCSGPGLECGRFN